MTICLNMIVKDEAEVIARCLRSVKNSIDYWVIVDTGSTDNTGAIIDNELKDIPGKLYLAPWKNFAHNRNEALELTKKKKDYLLFIDADEVLTGDLPENLTEDAYYLPVEYNNLRYVRGALVRNDGSWRWEGVVHEVMIRDNPVNWAKLDHPTIKVHTDGARSKDPDKYLKDANLLKADLEKNPTNARTAYYLSQSLRDAGYYEAAIHAYKYRAIMPGWDEETWSALYQIGRIKMFLGRDPEEVQGAMLKAYNFRPSRAEPLWQLMKYHMGRNEPALAELFRRKAEVIPFPDDRLFVEPEAYRSAA